MRQFILLLFILFSLTAFGQQSNKVIESMTTELYQVKLELNIERAKSNRLLYLLTAKELALRSSGLTDSTFKALAAIQAHNFWAKYKGDHNDIDIYQALYNSLKSFNDPLIKSLSVKIEKEDNLEYFKTKLMADKLCSKVKRNMLLDEWNKFASQLPYEATCPLTKWEMKVDKRPCPQQ